MARSFVRQGVNIICNHMTVSTPRKLGLNPAKELVETSGITIYSAIPEPLLNILDKKLDNCFKCKIPHKKWDGLAAFFAGIAIAATVVVVVVTAPVSGPMIAAIAASAVATAAATTAVAGTVAAAATSYLCYKLSHDCDIIFNAQWQNYHETVLIESQNALLSSSSMMCPVGGKLEIIIDDVLALNAAKIISRANNDDVFWNETNKFINGILAFATGGPFGATIASALEIYNTATDDGKDKSFAEGSVDSSIDATVAFEADTIKKIVTTSPYLWEDFIKDLKKGIYGAVVGFAIDQYFKKLERDDDSNAGNAAKQYNGNDEKSSKISNNAINIISTTQG